MKKKFNKTARKRIQDKFDALMAGPAIAGNHAGKPDALFRPYCAYVSQDHFRAAMLAYACENHVGDNPSMDCLEEAVDMLSDGLNYAHGSLVRHSALIFLRECRYARENIRISLYRPRP